MMDLYLHMGVALIVVSGLIIAVGYTLRRRQAGDGMMKIMGYQSLGPKKGIAMVKIGSEVLLVGVTATDVKLLKSMTAQPAAAERTALKAAPVASAAVPADSSDTLRRLRAIKNTLKEGTYAAH